MDFIELRTNQWWKTAVVALRAGLGALAIVVVGLLVLAFGSTPWILAVGMCGWLLCALVCASGFLIARSQLTGLRPGFLEIRKKLLSDTFHSISSEPQA
jgi:hypothetical protein